MSAPLRSKQGCWTCRLRKKKCDEGRPHCSTCEALSITCYGYGPKPDWMSNAEKEKEITNSLKEIVKHTSRRKPVTKQRDTVIRIAPKSVNASVDVSSASGSSSNHGVITPSDQELSGKDVVNMPHEDGSPKAPSSEHTYSLMARSIPSSTLPQDEACISNIGCDLAGEYLFLMHFLDFVFPLQYPVYKPDIMHGGRGWFLSLLHRTKPLYHAAIALSACHLRTAMSARISHSCLVNTTVQQERHLEICIKSLHQFVQNSDPENGLGTLTSVVQLVFFELFTDHGNAWQTHLRAAMSMYERGYEKNLAQLGLDERSRKILFEDLPNPMYEPRVTEEILNFRFVRDTIMWLDITRSITGGTAPHLLHYHLRIADSNSQTMLENVMGCKTWVMVQIGRIAELHEHKDQALQQGCFDYTGFQHTVCDISRAIECGLTALEDFDISESNSKTTFLTMPDAPTLITHMFAYMASVYVHLVSYGFQNLEALDTTISKAVEMVQTRIPTHILPALVCPMYVLGSVARQGDEQFFRHVFSSPILLDPLLKHRGRILPLLEEVWSRRQTTPGFTWKDSLELTRDILLL